MIILGVTALFSINLPINILANIKTQTSTQSLTHLLRSSRNQAIHLFTEVTVCPSNDDMSCHSDWNSPLISFIDSNHNNRRDNNEPINFRHYSSSELTVSYSRAIRLLKFNSTGRINSNGSFFLCSNDNNDTNNQALIINRQGRVRRARDSNGDGIVEDANANNLVC